jgi:hypothetical protein
MTYVLLGCLEQNARGLQNCFSRAPEGPSLVRRRPRPTTLVPFPVEQIGKRLLTTQTIYERESRNLRVSIYIYTEISKVGILQSRHLILSPSCFSDSGLIYYYEVISYAIIIIPHSQSYQNEEPSPRHAPNLGASHLTESPSFLTEVIRVNLLTRI